MKPESSNNKLYWMPAFIAAVMLVAFFWGGGYVLYMALSTTTENPKLFSLLDMIVVATISLTSSAVNYFIMSTHGNRVKDELIYNSTPAVTPTTTGEPK